MYPILCFLSFIFAFCWHLDYRQYRQFISNLSMNLLILTDLRNMPYANLSFPSLLQQAEGLL